MKKTKVLIICKAEHSTRGLQALLKEQGCDIVAKQWNARCVDDYRRVFASIVIFDVPLVVDEFFNACRSLCSLDNAARPVIIFLSPLPTIESAIQAFDAGVADIICPPLNPRDIVARIMVRLRDLHRIDQESRPTGILEKEAIADADKLIKSCCAAKALGEDNPESNAKAMSNFKKNLHALSSRIIASEESNCNRLARELHDCIGQNMTALKLNLNLIHQQLSPHLAPTVDQRLRQSIELASETTQKIREIMTALRCKVLDYDGLFAALRWEGNRFAERTGLRVDIHGVPIEPRPSPEVETALFRIAQEAMTNIIKHAEAAHVAISLEEEQDVIRLSITDDGKGFIPEIRVQRPDSGWGLIHMQERVEEQNGDLHIMSKLGEGTRIIAAVPR